MSASTPDQTSQRPVRLAANIRAGARTQTKTVTHTPGPWTTMPSTQQTVESERLDVVSQGTAFVPSFVAGDIMPEDAALIAAALDLLAALEVAIDAVDSLTEESAMLRMFWGDAISSGKAAIAKAKGTTH